MTAKRSRKRKPGGQPGNANALRHGFYASRGDLAGRHQADHRALHQIAGADLSEELRLLRIQIRRYIEAENAAAGNLDFESRVTALRAISLAADSLTRIVRLQTFLNLHAKEWKQIEERLSLFQEPPQSDSGS